MCLRPRTTRVRNVVTGSTKKIPVPCGKCIECTKRKQSDYAFLLSQHSLTHSKLDLVTLTYRTEAIPFSGVFEVIDPNGEVVEKSGIFWLKDEYHDSVASEYYSNDGSSGHQLEVPYSYLEGLEDFQVIHKQGTYDKTFHIDIVYSPKSVFSHKVGTVPDGYTVRSVVTSSLRRNDVKLCIKNARIRFRRLYGYNAKFSYFEVGEYGSRRGRPHVHIVFFDAPDDFLAIFRELWYRDYGTSDHEPVVARNGDDLPTAYEKVARYLSKYLTKGSFEKDFVKSGYVEKPRRISSKGIGHDRLDFFRSYCLAFDVFGEYDPDRPPKVVTDNLPLLYDRRYYTVYKDGLEYKLKIPKILYEKVLSRTYGLSQEDKKLLGFSRQEKTSFVYRVSHQRSTLSRLLSSYSKKHFEALLSSLIFQASSGRTKGPSSLSFRLAYAQISSSAESVRRQNAQVSWRSLRDFYSRSVD